jgi:hypothetical protein
MNKRHTSITYIVKSKTGSEEIQGIHFDQDVQVCGIFSNPNIFGIPLIMTFSLFDNRLGSRGYLYFFLFNTLEPSCVPFFFYSFLSLF